MLPLLVLVALQLRAGSGLHIADSDSQQPCRLQSLNASAPTAVCSSNATNIDLSNRDLSGRLVLTFTGGNNRSLDSRRQLQIVLLNVSGNPGLTGVTVASEGGPLDSVHISCLDISGSAMAPVPGRLLDTAARLLSVITLVANGTAYDQPLDLSKVVDLFYQIRVKTFTLIGWPLSKGQLPANLTSHAANRCGNKYFKRLTVRRSRFLREINGSSGDVLTVSDTIDFSGNGLRSVSNVAFSAGRVDLSDNQLTDLPGVAFRPGSYCGAVVTRAPTLLLRRNRLRYAALDSLAASVRADGFLGLDLSGNEQLLPAATTDATTNPKITVSNFLDLSGLGGHVQGLAAILARFRLSSWRHSQTFNLSLADNWIPDLAGAAAVVADFATVSGSNGTSAVPVHLDLSGNPGLVHLNLTDMPPHLLASLTARRLRHLRSASVRVSDAALVLERLHQRDRQSDNSILTDLWSRQVPLFLDAQPDRCCLADDDELLCSFGDAPAVNHGGAFCHHSDVAPFDGRHQSPPILSPELPLLFTCVVLGCALLLGLMTGVAIFYARRRSRGRYAVYSAHSVQVKEQQAQQQLQQRCCPPQLHLKAVTVCAVVPMERAATPV